MNFRILTPARIALAVAAAGVIGNLYLMLADALDAQANVTAGSTTPSSIDAVRGRIPGEPRRSSDLHRWQTQ